MARPCSFAAAINLGLPSAAAATRDPEGTREQALRTTQACIDLLSRGQANRLAHCSSFHVYGGPPRSIYREDDVPDPTTPYGQNHLACERLLVGNSVGRPIAILRLTNVAEPRLEFYEPEAGKKNQSAVVIVPGGGFGILASGHEGSDLALWLRDRGFLAAVLQHRCPTNKLPKPWELPAQDTQRALRLVRAKADELGIKSDRVGLFGFSAGGQVALIAATNAELDRLAITLDTDARKSARAAAPARKPAEPAEAEDAKEKDANDA